MIHQKQCSQIVVCFDYWYRMGTIIYHATLSSLQFGMGHGKTWKHFQCHFNKYACFSCTFGKEEAYFSYIMQVSKATNQFITKKLNINARRKKKLIETFSNQFPCIIRNTPKLSTHKLYHGLRRGGENQVTLFGGFVLGIIDQIQSIYTTVDTFCIK